MEELNSFSFGLARVAVTSLAVSKYGALAAGFADGSVWATRTAKNGDLPDSAVRTNYARLAKKLTGSVVVTFDASQQDIVTGDGAGNISAWNSPPIPSPPPPGQRGQYATLQPIKNSKTIATKAGPIAAIAVSITNRLLYFGTTAGKAASRVSAAALKLSSSL
jgi:hypothetical protein